MLFSLFSGIAFFFKAKNAHGTHSPFVFDLYNAVIEPNRGNIPHLKANLEKYQAKKLWEHYLVLEDIRGDNKTAWEELQQDPTWTITIDLFICGLAFTRPQQRKEHFVLKF